LVDKLTIEIKNDLSLPEAALAEADKSIIDVTTNSLEAYRYYLEGIENQDKMYFDEAAKSFRKAIEHDSTFAIAYYGLATNVTFDEAKILIQKAVKYSDKASRIEKFRINMAEKILSENITELKKVKQYEEYLKQYPEEKLFLETLGDYHGNRGQHEKALEYYYRVLELDPFYKQVYNSLAYLYEKMGDIDKSIWAINKYIEIAPDEANPYDSRGDLYAFSGKIDDAIESYKKALELKPDFMDTRDKLGFMHLFSQNYTAASGRDFNSAEDSYKEAMLMEKTTYSESVIYWQDYYIKLLALNNKIDSALKVLSVLKREIEDEDENANYYYANYWWGAGIIELTKGKAEIGIEYLEKAVNLEGAMYIKYHYDLARAYIESNRLGEAVEILEKTTNRYDDLRARRPIRSVKVHYLLGLAYEKSGWSNKAIEQYEIFLDIWKNADEGIVEIEDAKERLAKLKNSI